MKTVVITGSRSWPESEPGPIADALRGAEALIVGDATGADAIALRLALEWDVIVNVYAASRKRFDELHEMSARLDRPMTIVLAADWEIDFKKAGPKRNGVMVQATDVWRRDGFEVEAWAFPLPGSTGTVDCIKQLRKARFDVRVFGAPVVGENLGLF